jgi:hypothetical protein
VDGKRTLARYLSLMSDLREISDMHSEHELRLTNQEILEIHQQVESLPPSSLSFNSNLNDITHFMNALEFSIKKRMSSEAPAAASWSISAAKTFCLPADCLCAGQQVFVGFPRSHPSSLACLSSIHWPQVNTLIIGCALEANGGARLAAFEGCACWPMNTRLAGTTRVV